MASTVDFKVRDVEREIDRTLGTIRSLEVGAQDYAPLISRLFRASSKLGEASMDLSDGRSSMSENIRTALFRIRTAKSLIAEGVALKEEHDMRTSWGDV